MSLALPSPRDEAWRWADLKALPALAEASPAAERPALPPFILGTGARLVFVNGRIDAALSTPGPVALGPLDPVTDHALGRLATGQGWQLDLPAGSTGAAVEIVHVSTGGANHLPGRITLGEAAQAMIVETFIGDGWANRLTAITLAAGAKLDRVVRLAQDSGFQSLRDEAEIGADARLATTVLALGGAGSRSDARLVIAGEGGSAEMGGALLARDSQRHEAAVVVRHAAPGGTSRQLWRAVADDQATASLAARVEVARHAQQTDGEQSLRGLLLRRTATINLKPELEIFADDVKCAHGATVGELDRQALFYLASRGLPPVEARAILTRAFVADALEPVADEAVRAALLADAAHWLGARG
ncbi:SufD family Fe-S cluster assembly protein [Sphingomonas changnyeongensis]|uniref:SufD family Fe-S cluster assembly protein n=1 Tax=Sphingomonas changnyeongensis TaxID=2698679 RepID=A0A7Z2S5G6_9SPHN|nr:SufD family Fe-S cluster assembly protein [Sphingomonas changnyeongensis]QHL90343.1 SufD family Fe-S cluster assembly protein [Sphingomonas changnyeongensis]